MPLEYPQILNYGDEESYTKLVREAFYFLRSDIVEAIIQGITTRLKDTNRPAKKNTPLKNAAEILLCGFAWRTDGSQKYNWQYIHTAIEAYENHGIKIPEEYRRECIMESRTL